MEIRQLRHFLALVEEGGFSQAARRESIVQSGLSSSIKALENDLGVQLYVKGTRMLRLTAEGKALLPVARSAVRAIEATYQAVNAVSERLVGRLDVGTFTHVEHLVPISGALARLIGRYPGLQVRLTQFASDDMVQMLAAGNLDCAITSNVEKSMPGMSFETLAEEPYVLLGHRSHPLQHQAEILRKDLDGYGFIEMPSSWAARSRLDALFQDSGSKRKQVAEVNDWALALDLIANNAGLGFVPENLAVQEQRSNPDGVWYRAVADISLSRRIDFAMPMGHAASPAAKALRTELFSLKQRRTAL